ncbi:unnamed protein product, partial [Rotaria sordida]
MINYDLPFHLFLHIEESIDEVVLEHATHWGETHQNKLDNMRFISNNPQTINNLPTGQPPINSVTNLSKKILTNDELQALSNGFDFVCPSNSIDEESFISNIETFFVNLLGYITDKPGYEAKDANEPIFYKMTPIQL